ncbi:MAG: DUF1800 family protein [Ilumatobacter sp.]|uniref:DUF1800 domain-containing protein n=1 Tax=Ilumatobacter sp. TaxID=1967498 RepID=UPI00262CF28D|nr:DUF1800 family protein [Ilumatobacter sp.]MDJ0769368.1 DUF1800 family protein [Ilumatobacter sp.]
MPAQSDIEHLLRRTEFVARPSRVAELTPLSRAAAVDDILAVPANPGSVTFTESENWQRGEELTHFWLDRMAHDSPRPIQEKMGFFWHGHFCSEFGKVGSAELMREQIDLFRRDALGNIRSLATEMSTQVAMLRYLDNNQNRASSPNQNFARELMELFLLGVGNYTEADVEAATAAWTGHTDQWDTDEYVWRADWHDGSTKRFLGRNINKGGDPTQHGYEVIDVILGGGAVPNGAPVVANRGRPSNAVAAEFIAKKLWIEFAGTTPPAAVVNAMRDAALPDFDVTPMLRVLLNRDEFYTEDVRQGLVRSPVEFVVAALVATGRRSAQGTPLWLMEGMGQRPLFPPNVSGWKHNGYWVNASAMAQRTATARSMQWRSMSGYWDGDGLIHLGGGTISKTEVETTYRGQPVALLDRFLELMQIDLSPSSHEALRTYARTSHWWERSDLLSLILLTPDLHVA